MAGTRSILIGMVTLAASVILVAVQEFVVVSSTAFALFLACWGFPVLCLTLVHFRWHKVLLSAICQMILVLLWIAVPFSPQQRFFRQIQSVKPGMTVADVEGRMQEFTQCSPSWRAPEARPLSPNLTDTILYTHDDPDFGEYHCDSGTVTFQSGRVVEVYWLYDD